MYSENFGVGIYLSKNLLGSGYRKQTTLKAFDSKIHLTLTEKQ